MRRSVLFLLPLVAGCATRPAPVAVAVAPPPPAPVAVAAPLPPGASPGMLIPAVAPDGSYPTPNQRLTASATLWHLRAGINVAALSCPGTQGTGIIAGYNALIARHKAVLAKAEAAYATEFRERGGDWRDRYDDAMTRLYNYFSQTPARPALCAAVERVLAEAATVPPEGLAGFASAELAGIDRPFTDFYRAYDAWRAGTVRPAAPALVIAAASMPRPPLPGLSPARAATPAATPMAPAQAAPAIPPPAPQAMVVPHPRLTLDPSVFDLPGPINR